MGLKRVQRASITRLTVSAAGDSQQPKQQQQQQKQASTTAVTPCDSAAAAAAGTSTAEPADKDASLLQRFKRIIDEKKEYYEQEMRRRAQQGSTEGAGSVAEIIVGLLTPWNTAAAADPSSATPAATCIGRAKPPTTLEDDATSPVDLRQRKTTTSEDESGVRRCSQPAELSQNVHENSREKLVTREAMTMKTARKLPKTTDNGTFYTRLA